MVALGGRGEFGRLLFRGTGGGPITDDVLLDCPELAGSKGALFELEVVRDMLRGDTELRSGGAIFV